MSEGAKTMKSLVEAMNPGQNVISVQPKLDTTTDETTIFATLNKCNADKNYYLTVKPEPGTTKPTSSQRSVFTTNLQGDRHCRGLRIVLNNTFNAPGKVAPIFATMYGLSRKEMPGDEDIVAKIGVQGLVCGADQDPSNETEGFVVFVRGNVDPDTGLFTNEEDEDGDNSEPASSKEARVVKLYREKVYYPFIDNIRKNEFGFDWDGVSEVPNHLRAVRAETHHDGCVNGRGC